MNKISSFVNSDFIKTKISYRKVQKEYKMSDNY